MDVTNRKLELKGDIQVNGNCEDHTQINPVKVVKRPFDVAFLMLPDEKLKQKKLLKNYEKYEKNNQSYNNNESLDDEDEEIEVGNNQDFFKTTPHRYFTQKQQIFDDPTPIKPKNLDELRNKHPEQKSAFTKVNLPNKDLRVSPNLSISPDLTYQHSLSPSPPSRTYPISPNQLFKNHQINAYQANFLPDNPAAHEGSFLMKTPELVHQHSFQKMRPMYRPELGYNYQQFHGQEMLKIGPAEIRNPAAAILTSLLPPSLAALSLPAQNVCAKCNISFR